MREVFVVPKSSKHSMRATSETTVADQEGEDKFCSKYDTVSQSKKVRKVAMKEGLVFSTGAAEVAQCFGGWVVG